jgi:hypothetical protein
MSKPTPIKSSWLQGALYDPKAKVLTVHMKSGSYEYADVPPETYEKFAATFQSEASSGKFLNEHLKPLCKGKVKISQR